MEVDVTLYNEEVFPDNAIQQIQAIVTTTGNDFGIGKDVIPQRFFGPIYSNVSGIGNLVIRVARMYDPDTIPAPGYYDTTNIQVASRELSQFDPTRVTVSIFDTRRR